MPNTTIILSPNKPAIPAQGGHLDVLVRLQAPDLNDDHPSKHTPKRLSLVVDLASSLATAVFGPVWVETTAKCL